MTTTYGDVRLDGDRVPARSFDLFANLVRRTLARGVVDDDARARGTERERDRRTDPAGRTGDDADRARGFGARDRDRTAHGARRATRGDRARGELGDGGSGGEGTSGDG